MTSINGLGGADILLGGGGNDELKVSDLGFRRIVGGNGFDALFVEGSGRSLNLLNISDNRIVDIEQINITGTGDNTLTLTQREVLNLSSTTNTLNVVANAGDRVGFEPGWTKQSDFSGFQVFTKGAATLRVSVGVSFPSRSSNLHTRLLRHDDLRRGANDQSGYSSATPGTSTATATTTSSSEHVLPTRWE